MGNAITHLCPRAAQIYAALRSDTCVRTTPTRVPLIIIRAYSDVCQRYAGTVSPDDGNDAADLRRTVSSLRASKESPAVIKFHLRISRKLPKTLITSLLLSDLCPSF